MEETSSDPQETLVQEGDENHDTSQINEGETEGMENAGSTAEITESNVEESLPVSDDRDVMSTFVIGVPRETPSMPTVYKPESTSTWKSLGSEKEIDDEKIVERPPVKYSYSRPGKHFGKDIKFSDMDAIDTYTFYPPYKDPNYSLNRMEHDFGIQAVTEVCTTASQTDVFRKTNKATQFSSIDFLTEQAEITKRGFDESSIDMSLLQSFLEKTAPLVAYSISQNLTIDVFKDDFEELENEDTFVGKQDHSNLKEYQSFQHITYSKNKRIAAIDWQPKSRTGVIATACINPDPFDERLRLAGKTLSSYVVVWSTADPIYPQMVLEAPCDVLCIRFNPTQPNLIVGGCVNGQICLWDLDKLKDSVRKEMTVEGEEKERPQIPTIRWTQLSAIESGHKRSVNDILWLPENNEVTADGRLRDQSVLQQQQEQDFETEHLTKKALNGTATTHYPQYQFLTLGSDGVVFVWDIRKENQRKPIRRTKDDKDESLPWLPYMRFNMLKLDGATEIGGYKFCIDEKSNPYFLCCTTEEGEFVFADWTPKSKESSAMGVDDDKEKASSASSIVRTIQKCHFNSGTSIHKNPHFRDIYVTTGDWTIQIWKLFISKPLINSSVRPAMIMCARWSPTRPGVLFVGRADGFIEIWDLSDKSHEPSVIQSVSAQAIISFEFRTASGRSKYSAQLLAIGDESGTLHIMEVPINLIKPSTNEHNIMETFLTREVDYVNYYEKRWIAHRQEFERLQRDQHNETARKQAETTAAAAANSANTQEDDQDKREEEFLAMKKQFLQMIKESYNESDEVSAFH